MPLATVIGSAKQFSTTKRQPSQHHPPTWHVQQSHGHHGNQYHGSRSRPHPQKKPPDFQAK